MCNYLLSILHALSKPYNFPMSEICYLSFVCVETMAYKTLSKVNCNTRTPTQRLTDFKIFTLYQCF